MDDISKVPVTRVHRMCPDALFPEAAYYDPSNDNDVKPMDLDSASSASLFAPNLTFDERKSIFDAMVVSPKLGDTWYVVDARLMRAIFETGERSRIDNSTICTVDNDLQVTCLRPGIAHGGDYLCLTESQYAYIMKNCGGGPHIPRRYVEEPSNSYQHADVRPWRLTVNDGDVRHIVYISHTETVRYLKRVCDIPVYVQLEVVSVPSAQSIMNSSAPMNDSFPLEDALVQDGCVIGRVDDSKVLLSGSSSSLSSSSSSLDHMDVDRDDDIDEPKPAKLAHHDHLAMTMSPVIKPALKLDGPGTVGLSNLGNTCFMNSGLQCLMHTLPLKAYFEDVQVWSAEINRENPLGSGGHIAEQFGKLIRECWSMAQNSIISPREFKFTIGRFAPQFSGYAQHDSQELLAFLLDGLHEDLNRVRKKPYTDTSSAKSSTEAWELHRARNDSIIVDTFQGQLKSTLVCPKCEKVSVTWDPFMYLSLPLPNDSRYVFEVIVLTPQPKWVPVKLSITLPKFGKASLLFDSILAKVRATGVQAEDLAVADWTFSRLYRVIDANTPLESIRADDRERLVAYVFPTTVSKSDWFELTMSTMRISQTSKVPPMLVPSSLNAEEQMQAILEYVRPFVKDPQILEEYREYVNMSAEEREEKKDGMRMKVMVDAPSSSGYSFSSKPRTAIHVDLASSDDLVTLDAVLEQDDSVRAHSESRRRGCSLKDCLDLFVTQEVLGDHDMWYCPTCKEHVHASKKFDLARLPECLVIHLKRFQYSTWSRSKIETPVNFPTRGLELSQYVVSDQASAPESMGVYDLYAVSNHFGGLFGGHYTAHACARDGWFDFDDSSVSRASEQDLDEKSSYVLFYRKRHQEP
jgi:ubiquitin C-terminal hydrolase